MSEQLDIKRTKSSKRRSKKEQSIYASSILNRIVYLPMKNVGSTIKDTFKLIIENEISGKCISEGFIKPGSINILTYSNGVVDGSNVKFDVVLECLVCNPVDGQIITCQVINITKAGIRAKLLLDDDPLVIFVARDHNYMSKFFSSIEENQEISVRIIGQRFELNDPYISVIAELVEPKIRTSKQKIKVDESITVSPILSLVPEVPSINVE